MEMVRIAKVDIDSIPHVPINPFFRPHVFEGRVSRGDCIVFCVCAQKKLLRTVQAQPQVQFALPKHLLCLNPEWDEDPNLGWYQFDPCHMTHESVYNRFDGYVVNFYVILQVH